MAKKLKVYNAVLCEHAVAGAQNKPTLINVYSGDIIVTALPATLTFGIFVEIARETTPKEMRIEFLFDGAKIAEIGAGFGEPKANSTVTNLIVPMVQVGIDRDVTFEIVAIADGYARTTLISTRIYKGDASPFISPTA